MMIPIASARGTGVSGAFIFSNIPQNYKSLQIRMSAREAVTNTAIAPMYFYFNSDASGTSYSFQSTNATGTTATQSAAYSTVYFSAQNLPALAAAANVNTSLIFDIPNYASTDRAKTMTAVGGFDNNSTSNQYVAFHSFFWNSTAAITAITITPGFTTSSIATLYGMI